jgi:hypothetical protein
MNLIVALSGVGLLLAVLWEAFETFVLPRRVRRRFRLTRAFYLVTWLPWRALARRRKPGSSRENLLSVFGPISLLLLVVTWAAMLVVGFASIQWGLGSRLQTPTGLPRGFSSDLYFSGTTLFTLGLGEVTPLSQMSRVLTVAEAGTGLAFLALIIGYLPMLAQAFSRREVNVTLLDARAGSPPSAVELLRRHASSDGGEALTPLIVEWERWVAEILETHISFPVLAYYRSQHDNQSWIAALTTVLDVCALITAGMEKGPIRSARLTFAMARHAAVDLCNLFKLVPRAPDPERLPPTEMARVRAALDALDLPLPRDPKVEDRLHRLRQMYEPYLNALGTFLLMPLPGWLPGDAARDNWQSMQ